MDGWLFFASVGAFGLGAHRIASAALARESVAVRATAAIALGGAAAITILVMLAAYRVLLPWTVTVAAVLFAIAGHRFAASRPGPPEPPDRDPDPKPLLPLLVPVVAALPHLMRAMASPPRAWDALTYHLPRAAQWTQDAGFSVHVAPDATRYYELFAPGGDLLFAFTMLAGQGDALLFLLYAGVFGACLLAAFALAEALGAKPLDASLAAAVVMTLPSVVQLSGSAYVDSMVLFFTLAGATAAVRAAAAERAGGALLVALLSAGACAVIKSSAIPLLAVVGVYGGWLVARRRVRPAVLAGGLAIAALPLALWMTHTAIHTGSPTYPIGLSIAGLKLTQGNLLFRITHDGTAPFLAPPDGGVLAFSRGLFVGTATPDWPHLNLGLGGAVAIALGGIALGAMKDRPPAMRVLLVVMAVLPFALVLLPSAATLRGMWGPVTGRLLSPLAAIPACAAAAGAPRLFRYGLGLALALALPTLMPAGVTLDDLERGVVPIALGVALLLGLAAPFRLPLPGRHRAVAVVVVLALAPLVGMALAIQRAPLREGYYAASSFEIHPAPIATQARLWAALDGDRPERIALSVGWVPPGHQWFRYPLYGSRLQNRVTYVPATRSGEVYDTWDPALAGADLDADAYVERLRRRGITAIVYVAPAPPEASIVMEDHARFVLRYETPRRDGLVYGWRPAD
ncbi:MAG: hypothetical protein R3B82_02120 [Sandaracinaceae bacterium]